MNTYTQYDLYMYLPDRNIYVCVWTNMEVSHDSKEILSEKKQKLGNSMRKKEIFVGFVRSYYSQTNIWWKTISLFIHAIQSHVSFILCIVDYPTT